MKKSLAIVYIGWLNSLKTIFSNDNMEFKVSRKNITFPSDSPGTMVERYQISLILDGVAHEFCVVYSKIESETIRVQYNDEFIDEVMMCLGGEFMEYYELGLDDIYYHTKKFESKYFILKIHQVFVDQKRGSVIKALRGMSGIEVRKITIMLKPIWSEKVKKTDPKYAHETIRVIRTILADIYDDKVAKHTVIKISKYLREKDKPGIIIKRYIPIRYYI